MRIIAFDVRPDEREEFGRQAARADVDELVCREEPLTAENAELVREFNAVLTQSMISYDADLLARLAECGLRVLVTRTIGTDHIDLAAAERLGIAVSNTSYAPDSVADFTLMLMLVALRKYKQMIYRQNVNDFSLPGLMGRTLSSLTVGVVGTGRIGRAVARRLRGFGARVVAYDPVPSDEFSELGTYVSLDELFSVSDVITFHTPSTPENFHMVRDETLAKMRDGVVLVNTARASLMDVNTLGCGHRVGQDRGARHGRVRGRGRDLPRLSHARHHCQSRHGLPATVPQHGAHAARGVLHAAGRERDGLPCGGRRAAPGVTDASTARGARNGRAGHG